MLPYDDLTMFIITSICEATLKKEKITTWSIAKKRAWDDKPLHLNCKQESHFYSKKSMLVMERLQAMAKEGFLIVENFDHTFQFTLIRDRVKFLPRFKFPSGKFYKAISITRIDEREVVYQVN